MNGVRACGGFRRLAADKKLFESRECIVNAYLRVASNIRLVSSQMRPRQKHAFISSQLVPHSAQITIRSLWKKKAQTQTK